MVNKTEMHYNLRFAEKKGIVEKQCNGYRFCNKICNYHILKLLGAKAQTKSNERRKNSEQNTDEHNHSDLRHNDSAHSKHKNIQEQEENDQGVGSGESEGASSRVTSVHHVIKDCWTGMEAFFQNLEEQASNQCDFSRPVLSEQL